MAVWVVAGWRYVRMEEIRESIWEALVPQPWME